MHEGQVGVDNGWIIEEPQKDGRNYITRNCMGVYLNLHFGRAAR